MAKHWKSLILGAAAIAISLMALWTLSNRPITATQNDSSSVLVATITVVGVIWTAMTSLLAAIIKQSIDDRSISIQNSAETRFKMEASLKAIELITTPTQSDHLARERREGAILALVSIDHMQLVISLLDQYLSAGLVSIKFGVRVIDQCLRSADPTLQYEAADLLQREAARLTVEDGFIFPDSVFLKWNPSLPKEVKATIVHALMECMLSRRYSDWQGHSINSFVYCLYKIFSKDPEPSIATMAAYFAQALAGDKDHAFMPPDQHSMNYPHVKERAKEILADLGGIFERISTADSDVHSRITRWMSDR